jgi:hypothetical protein
MSSGFTVQNVAGILKELYDDQKVQWLTYKDNPFLAMIKKEEKFPGKYFPVPVVYGLSQGSSATFTTTNLLRLSQNSWSHALLTFLWHQSMAKLSQQLKQIPALSLMALN